jgi:hypothetical protein
MPARISWWKPVGLLLLGNVIYFGAVMFLLANGTSIANLMMGWLPIVYFVIPAILSLLVLSFTRALSFRAEPLRTLFLITWSIVLPVLTFCTIIFGLKSACQVNWLHCLPY